MRHALADPVGPLRQKLFGGMNMRHFPMATPRNYIRDAGRFASFLRRRPDTLTAKDGCQFQLAQGDAGVSIEIALIASVLPSTRRDRIQYGSLIAN